jgi:hypothetical protein
MKIRTFCLIGTSVAMSGCGLVGLVDKDYAFVTQGTASSTIHLIGDTSKVRALIADHSPKTRQAEEMERSALREFVPAAVKARSEFLVAMAREPGIEVPGNSYARFLETSNAGCDKYGNRFTYVRARITSGPRAGEEGWACFIEVSPTFP